MEILETIFPILAIPAGGYYIARRKIFSEAECDAIARFVFTFVIPALLFVGTLNAKLPEDFSWGFMFSYYISVFLVYFIGALIGKYVFNQTCQEQSIFGMGAAYSNATIVGIPICIYILGEESLLPLFIIISIHNLALFAIGVLVAERDSISLSSSLKSLLKISKGLFLSPITGSLIVGGILNISNVPIYKPFEDTLELMSHAAVPAALFVLGASLNKYKIYGHIAPAIVMVALKMLLLPLLVWFFGFHVFILPPLLASTALLCSAMPMGISVYLFSQKYQVSEACVATGIVLSTLFSIFSLTVISLYVQKII